MYTNTEMAHQLAVRLPDELYDRLKHLSEHTGRHMSFYLRQALEEYLEDLEDIYEAELVLERLKKGQERRYSAEEVWGGLDLDD